MIYRSTHQPNLEMGNVMNSVIANTNHDLTIVVNTCDAYADVLQIFFHAMEEYWPNCPYPIVINTELSTPTQYPASVHNYSSKDKEDNWGDRLRETLKSIETEFVLMLYDDFILEAAVSNHEVQEAKQLLINDTNAAAVYLIDTQLSTENTSCNLKFQKLKDKIDYKLNSAPGIWRRSKLLSYTFPGDTPWAWEVFGTYRSFGDKNVFYSLSAIHKEIYQYNHEKGGGIYRGKWVREVVSSKVDKYQLSIDFSIRGFSAENSYEKRPWAWKIKFMKTGYKMVGLRCLYFLLSYFREKINGD